jgi:uncharacterized RmlC-like cupin family protein
MKLAFGMKLTPEAMKERKVIMSEKYEHHYVPLEDYEKDLDERRQAIIIHSKNVGEDTNYEKGLSIKFGINRDSVNSQRIVLGINDTPPMTYNPRHYHVSTEASLYIISGHLVIYTGPEATPQVAGPGDYVYIPVGCIHGIANPSKTVPAQNIFAYGGISNKEDAGTIFIEESDDTYPPANWMDSSQIGE